MSWNPSPESRLAFLAAVFSSHQPDQIQAWIVELLSIAEGGE